MSADGEVGSALRIDRWLWCTRFFKSRSAAAAAVRAGHVRLNGRRVKPAHDVRCGDLVTIDRGVVECDVTVVAIPSRRGPSAEAQTCYAETAASTARRAAAAAAHAAAPDLAPTSGRPDKRTRRLLLRARRN
jgi:ribosome-associated heat shock protein Hsp15